MTYRITPTINTMTIEKKLSDTVSIVSDGLAILVIVRNSVAGVFDKLANATDFALALVKEN